MAETGKAVKEPGVATTDSTKTTEAKPAGGKLGRASESGDPAVHKALADLQAAQMNRAALDVPAADVKAADDAVKDAQKALADLGHE
jgi:hypothetical protein